MSFPEQFWCYGREAWCPAWENRKCTNPMHHRFQGRFYGGRRQREQTHRPQAKTFTHETDPRFFHEKSPRNASCKWACTLQEWPINLPLLQIRITAWKIFWVYVSLLIFTGPSTVSSSAISAEQTSIRGAHFVDDEKKTANIRRHALYVLEVNRCHASVYRAHAGHLL